VLAPAGGRTPGERIRHLGSAHTDVVTNAQFEEIAAAGKIKRPSDGKEAKSVVFIQSPGQGGDQDFPYAGSVTSLVALKQATYVREDYADGKAYIIYQHMRTPGMTENFYNAVQQDPGVFLTKGQVTQVSPNGTGLIVNADDTLLGQPIQIKADIVVLATGMVPATKDDPVINLAYRQGPGFRDNAIFNDYADSNYICFPYETQRTGIYAAGAIRRSLSTEESMEDAAGAALKAIQCLESVNRGVSVHPRSGDLTFPDFFFQRCTQCKRCTQECPFGALDDDERGTPKTNPTRCRRCGTCMGACPERIINFANYSIDSVSSMVKAIKVPSTDDFDEPPLRVLGLICENDAYPALDIAALNRLYWNADVRFIPVAVWGQSAIWIRTLSKGMDGVFLMGQARGRLPVPLRAQRADRDPREENRQASQPGARAGAGGAVQVAIGEYDKIPQMLQEFVGTIEGSARTPSRGSTCNDSTKEGGSPVARSIEEVWLWRKDFWLSRLKFIKT
jgi:quinone-modifying oxidoreductase subunit QmoB